MFKKILVLLLAFFLWIPAYAGMTEMLGMTKVVFAADEFGTSYDVIYDIGLDGVTTVTEKVALRNLTSQYYASQFKLTIGATDIFDIKASDPGGSLEVSSEQKDSSTIITVKFNQQVTGIDKVLPWTLQFRSRDFAEKIGKVWEVRAPRISTVSNLENYNLTLSVPTSFGEPTLISPVPKSQTVGSGKMFFTFDKGQLETSGVSASFGNTQLFDFDLSYHLDNNNLFPILTNIALPPDSAYQDVIFQRITPPPVNVTVDADGNYLAWFNLRRGEKLDVRVIGSAKLYSSSKAKDPKLPSELRKRYLSGSKFWEKDHPEIIAAVNRIFELSSPVSDQEKIEAVYRYVVSTLKYDSSRLSGDSIERLGAATTLSNPSNAVCMEFTDLFIALARAAGIPARELDGYAYTANPTLRPLSLNKDILHAWPEYWDERKGWIMVDPTWENTTGGVDYFNKLDLNHFVFAIKGLSDGPVPAGSYKYIGEDSHDVKVSLAENDFLGKSQIDVSIDSPDPLLAAFPAKLKVKITNSGNSVFSSPEFAIKSSKITILDSNSGSLGPIPAFGNATFEYNIKSRSLFERFNDQIVVSLGGKNYTKDITVEPFILFKTIPLIAVGIVLLMVSLYGLILGVFFYRKRVLGVKKK